MDVYVHITKVGTTTVALYYTHPTHKHTLTHSGAVPHQLQWGTELVMIWICWLGTRLGSHLKLGRYRLCMCVCVCVCSLEMIGKISLGICLSVCLSVCVCVCVCVWKRHFHMDVYLLSPHETFSLEIPSEILPYHPLFFTHTVHTRTYRYTHTTHSQFPVRSSQSTQSPTFTVTKSSFLRLIALSHRKAPLRKKKEAGIGG